ncbi:MAG: hypothetical protein UY70_C0015G0012 [Candidatus Kaiserbacteria bacterium GW2011_GWB1_52_6]|uniref:DUF2231 domain-containing protein n=3 Tax=Candidatus Kaiseribacteriota TaxID=1752734 RepID=A0A0G2AFA8_9BACT|nr:MAG: hypothetical protein UY67_C0009G0019 [Candidatus Kaiserbacteria bacterium GW2011_GWA2_52_12]KKW27391.1 MAG: hypothetical protein UY70_C0015G0012 [Candidatus Kaiserbacteria bacterium GW2011_GWB1_52_6]KKW31194.1 MAG: hypothetical protein UY74_C0021G0006 [Candidatus Kaiserbacteria bacterium GW2011_GWC2_52_8b]
MREFLLMVHPTTGALAIFATIWVFVEALNASAQNRARLLWGSIVAAVFMVITCVVGGYWYVTYYAADKAIILAGPWPMAHTVVMEFKEHLFFATLILSLLLPIVIWSNNIVSNRGVRMLVLVIAALVVLTSFAIEGAGAMISMAVRMGLIQ